MSKPMKRYSAKDMREAADEVCDYIADAPDGVSEKISSMLCQAAQREEDFRNVSAGLKWKDSENEIFRARLDAIAKECEKWKWADDNWCTSVKDATDTHNRCIDRILRIVRGKECAV